MKKLSLYLSTVVLSTGIFLTSAVSALAADVLEPININPPAQFSALGGITPARLVSGGIRLILVIAALLFFFMLVIGGIQWIVSGGDKAASENARKRITSALVGLAIVFVAWAIVGLIKAMFNVDIFQLNLPTFVGNQAP